MTVEDYHSLTPGPEQGYQLVRQASDRYRRTATNLDRARKRLAVAEREHEQSKRDLKMAIVAVQPTLIPEYQIGNVPPGVDPPCCAPRADYDQAPHAPGCPRMA